jgi:hypothetical protein
MVKSAKALASRHIDQSLNLASVEIQLQIKSVKIRVST